MKNLSPKRMSTRIYARIADRPVTRYDAVQCIEEAVSGIRGAFDSSRSMWAYSPALHSPKLSNADIDTLERKLKEAIKNLRLAIKEDRGMKLEIARPKADRSRDNSDDLLHDEEGSYGY